MTDIEEPPSQKLCKSCGLCCDGQLFAWVRLNAGELDRSAALGLNVIRNDPRQRGFTQPCPLWNGTCTIYASPDYPRSCGTYKCKVLRELLDGDLSLPHALAVVQETLELIGDLEARLPASPRASFRERLISHKEYLETLPHGAIEPTAEEFIRKSTDLLLRYQDRFGVDDFIDYDA